MQVQKCGFKTIQCDPLQIGKGIVDLGFFIVEEVLAVSKIQLTLKNNGMEFLGVGTMKWIRFPEFGLGCRRMVLDKLSIAVMILRASTSSGLIAGVSARV